MKIEYILLWSLSCLVVYTDAAKVANISHSSQGSPDFYLNDEVTFTCSAAGFSDIELLTLAYNDPNTGRSGCRYDGVDNKWGVRGPPFIGQVDGLVSSPLTPEYCAPLGKAEGFIISVNVTITDAAVNGKFFCRASDGADTLSSREISVTFVKVAPTSLTMSVPEDVVEDEEFEVNCESTGGDPVSDYRYETTRGGTVVPTTGNTYTPTVADRGGFTITCTDTAHRNWKGGNTMMTSKEVLPKYIEAKEGQTDFTEYFNPYYKYNLNCADHVTGNPLPDSFNWTRNDIKLVEASSALNLIAKPDGTEETVTCVASNGLGKDVTITWKIKCSSAVTTTIIPTTTTPKPIHIGAIVGAVLTVNSVIIAIAVGCYCYKKRKVPKAQAPQRPIDDPVIYADLVHDSQVPEHEYMAVNTRDDNGEPAIPTSMAPAPSLYGNVED